jgi:hypothetical protein
MKKVKYTVHRACGETNSQPTYRGGGAVDDAPSPPPSTPLLRQRKNNAADISPSVKHQRHRHRRVRPNGRKNNPL